MPFDGTEPESGSEREREDASRRRSMIALVAVIVLVAAALYIGHVLKKSSALEDCELQGRTNCESITTEHN